MPATRAQVLTTLKEFVERWDELERNLNGGSGYVDYQEDVIESLEGDEAGRIVAHMMAERATLSSIFSPDNIFNGLAPHMADFATAVNKPHGSDLQNFITFRDDLEANSDTVNSRGITFDTSVIAGGTGSGTLYRVTVDKYGNPLEGGHVESKYLTCTLDQNSAPDGEQAEVFLFEGEAANIDFLSISGSGIRTTLTTLNARNSTKYLRNPSFSSFTGTAPTASTPTVLTSTTQITGWTVDTAANFEVQLDTVYRTYPGETLAYAVRFKDNGTLTQVLASNQKPKFSSDRPYIFAVAIYRESNCDGNLTIRLGASSKTVAMSSLSNGAWNVVTIDLDEDSYYDNFTEADLDVQITLASRTTGAMIADDITMDALDLIDATYWGVMGGATPFLKGKTMLVTDTEGAQPTNRGILQYWISHRSGISRRLGFAYALASDNSGSETIADP